MVAGLPRLELARTERPVAKALEAQWSQVFPDWNWGDGSRARDGQVATLGYVHSLSPRTSLYAMVGVATRYSLQDQVVQGQGTTRRVKVGVNHAF